MAGSDGVQRLLVLGREYDAHSTGLQAALGSVYQDGPRPRCLCRPGGVEMYVARHGHFVAKRMPGSGAMHHPACPSFEPEAAQSGLGELVGDAVLEGEPGQIELRVAFPWAHALGTGSAHGPSEGEPPGEVAASRRRMSLRAVVHYLFEAAGFNRWVPGMRGKRHQAVVHKYLMEAAGDVIVKGERLAQRLYVPEPFNEATRTEVARRRQAKLAVLQPAHNRWPMALLIGEFKAVEPLGDGMRVWIKHMPDVPLCVERKVWARIARAFAPVLEAGGVDGAKPRQILAALIRARREQLYEIDAASLMLTSVQWIPVEGVHELPLVDALVAQDRRFIKPLRYDASAAARFPNALLLDVGATPVPLHVSSPFLPAAEQAAKARALAAEVRQGHPPWVWLSGAPMPALPPAGP